jgi:hypothetical protein
MHDIGDEYPHYRERDVMEDRVYEDPEQLRVRHHWRLSKHAYQTRTQNVGSVEWVGPENIDDRKPYDNCRGSDYPGKDSFTHGIVPLSHRSSS